MNLQHSGFLVALTIPDTLTLGRRMVFFSFVLNLFTYLAAPGLVACGIFDLHGGTKDI